MVLDAKGRLAGEPQVSAIGLLEAGDDEMADDVVDAVHRAVGRMPASSRKDDDKVREEVRIAVRRAFRDAVGKKPVTQVHLVRL